MLSSHFSEIGLSSTRELDTEASMPGSEGPRRNVLEKPNLAALHQLNDDIDRVVDNTAEQVRKTFENFLNKYTYL